MLALGLGTFLLANLWQARTVLLSQLRTSRDLDGPNLVLFDIQPDQRAGVEAMLTRHHLPIMQAVPIVTMRLSAINGTPVADLHRDPAQHRERWALRHEYRSTYRDHLVPGEALTRGQFPTHLTKPTEPIPITIETGVADDMGVTFGDMLTWDIQGIPMQTQIVGLRTVDWYRMQPNFFVVFPTGVLEDAPQIFVEVTRVPDVTTKAALQDDSVQHFPNVSVLDASLIVKTLDDIFDRISFAVRFMSMFSILTGLIVLLGSVSTSRYQRLRENVLLRALGASRRQIVTIAAVEFLWLGSVAAITGIGLSVATSWGLAHYLFETKWALNWLPLTGLWLTVTLATLALGMLNSLTALRRPPLEVLRTEQ